MLISNEEIDLKTLLYLHITGANVVTHPEVKDVEIKRKAFVKNINKNDVYIFKNYEEYKNFFLMYLDEIDEEIIDLAIYTKGKKGQIIALKGLCEHIILKKKVSSFYQSITKEQIEKIHKNGKLTPLEIVQIWESNGTCAPGSYNLILEKHRCTYFNYNCHDCLLEFASHKLEHDDINSKLENSVKENNELVLKK